MNTRCKPGDMAVYVGNIEPLLGQVTTCVSVMTCVCGKPTWLIDPPLQFAFLMMPACHDESLQPLRDQPGQDQSLTWAKVPSNKVPA